MGRMILVCLAGLWLMPPTGFGQEATKDNAQTAATSRSQANTAYEKKNYVACARLFEQAASLSAGGSVVNDYYNAACCHARARNMDDAFATLERAIEAGYRNLNHIKDDSDLEFLHDDSRWKKLLVTIKVPPIRITTDISKNPNDAPFVYDDIRHFLHAMTLVSTDDDLLPILQAEYFDKGSPGLKMYIEKYALTPEGLAAAIKKRPDKYRQLGERMAQLQARESSIREALVRFADFVSNAIFPPTYFLVADYSGVASGSPEGQLITLERRTSDSIERIETLIVHELVHFQQLVSAGSEKFYAVFGEEKSLLALTIREGTAEFIADRVTGRMSQEDARAFTLEHEEEIWKRFQLQKSSRDTGDWMWSTPSDPDQPRDLAYAFGAHIVEAYYKQASDMTRLCGRFSRSSIIRVFSRRVGTVHNSHRKSG